MEKASNTLPARAAGALGTLVGRIGGVLVSPRATLRAFPQRSLPGEGALMVGLYVLAAELPRLAEGVASASASAGFNGALSFANYLGRALFVPWVAMILFELLVGTARRRVAPALLAPLVVMGALGSIAQQQGWIWPGPKMGPAAFGVLWGAALAFAARNWAEPEPALGERPADEPLSSSRAAGVPLLSMVAGLVLSVVLGGVATRDLVRISQQWDSLGPLGPRGAIPEFSLPHLEGAALDRADLRGQVTVLAFWATWCSACSAQMPDLAQLNESLGELEGKAEVQLVNVDEVSGPGGAEARLAKVREYADGRQLDLPIVLDDGLLSKAFRVQLLPHVVLVGRDGEVAQVYPGRVGSDTLLAAASELSTKP